ncbi:MAG: ankyrin repeat domain-containing protein [Alphaproteobacteria bacterium]|nr:ankyrin repeat domain-containing protein [Alphaproteobacteria bacterium]
MKKYIFIAALMFAYTPSIMASDQPQHQEPATAALAEESVAENTAQPTAPEPMAEPVAEHAAKPVDEHAAKPEAEVAVKKRAFSMQEMRSALKSGKPALEKLIAEGADINAKDPRTGLTLLHETASEGNIARVQTLHEVGADMNVQNNQGATALHMASRVGHIKAVQKLVDLGVKTDVKNQQGLTAHAVAHANGNKPIAAILENHPK